MKLPYFNTSLRFVYSSHRETQENRTGSQARFYKQSPPGAAHTWQLASAARRTALRSPQEGVA